MPNMNKELQNAFAAPGDERLSAVLSRRSIRQFTGRAISYTEIVQLLRAAMSAPSAGNEQPWKFVVIDDKDILLRASVADQGMQVISEGAAAILICAEPRLTKYRGYWPEECAAATQNILIAAHILGLGSLWLGIYPVGYRMRRIRKILHLPRRIIPFAFVSLGYASEKKPPSDRFDPHRIHLNCWLPEQDIEIKISFAAALGLFLKRNLRQLLKK
jgi:nitroreductase